MTSNSELNCAPPMSRYERFFTYGSFALLPELTQFKNIREYTSSWIRLGLAIDDGWDFGVERNTLNGRYIDPSDFLIYCPTEYLRRIKTLREQTERSAFQLSAEYHHRQYAIENNRRFETGLMLNEAIALAIPYDDKSWTPDLIQMYREVDAMIWGAMYSASRPKSALLLPEVWHDFPKYKQNPFVGLSQLRDRYAMTLQNSGKSGKDALAITWHLMYIQNEMDKDDREINYHYKSPALHIFFPEDRDIGQSYIHNSKAYTQKLFSFTMNLYKLFPFVYSTFSNVSSWRKDIPDWKYMNSPSIPNTTSKPNENHLDIP